MSPVSVCGMSILRLCAQFAVCVPFSATFKKLVASCHSNEVRSSTLWSFCCKIAHSLFFFWSI